VLWGTILIFILILTSFANAPGENPESSFSKALSISSASLYLSAGSSGPVPPSLRISDYALESNRLPSLASSQVLGSIESDKNSNSNDNIIHYEVKKGDNLWTVADKFDVTLETLLWANDLTKSSNLKVGQKLLILPTSGVLCTVKKGDTLSEIAQLYEGEVEEIVSYNNLESKNDIVVGDLLIIPGGEEPDLASISYSPLAENYFIYPSQGVITQGAHGYQGNAVDIGNNCGNPVVAAASGEVLRAGPIWVGGNRITILHDNGVVTYYGHLSSMNVSPGQRVSAGDIIGYIGNTGYTLGVTGCHVHFTVRGARNFLTGYPVGSTLRWK